MRWRIRDLSADTATERASEQTREGSGRVRWRVVHVSAHYPPFLGGVERVVESLATEQKKSDLEVEVVTSRDRCSGPNDRDPDFVRRLRSWEFANTSIMPALPRVLTRLPRNTIVHVHVAQAFIPEVVYASHLLRKRPYIAHLHQEFGPSGWAGFLLRLYKPMVLGTVLRAADIVVVFTDEQRSIMSSKYNVNPARVVVIPNGVGEEFRYVGNRCIHSKPRLLFVGRFTVEKNLILLLHSLEGISHQFETTLVGDGKLEPSLKEAAKDLGLENVRFYGRAGGAELHQLYRDADIFVLPSMREGLPLVLLEALAMGLPIVATDVPGSRDLVVDGENGALVPLGKPAALREALLRVAGDPLNYRRMSDNCLRFAENYSWAKVAAEFERLYSQLGGES